jgi:hypothetical protein
MVVVLVVVGSSLFADAKWGGIARQIAMGGSQAGSGLILNPFIMDDPSLMLLNPAYQAMYKDYAWMNLGGGTALGGFPLTDEGYTHQYAGVSFALGKEMVIGTILSYDPSAVNAVGGLIGNIAQRGTQSIPGVANVWELLFGYDAGDLDVGLGVTYGRSNNDTTFNAGGATGNAEASANMFGVRAGINFNMGSGNSVEAYATFRSDDATDKITATPTPTAPFDGEYSASATELDFGARAKMKVSNKFSFVPFARVAILSAEPKEDVRPATITTAPTSFEVNVMGFAVGLGGELRTADFFMAGGLSFQTVSAEIKTNNPNTTPSATSTKTTLTYTSLPMFNVGGEWWFTDWLAGRGGYQRAIATIKREYEVTAPAGNTTGEANTTFPHSFIAISGFGPGNTDGIVTLGLGFKFGNFSLDATVSEQALRRGLGLIGAADNMNTFGVMNASYNFE